MYSTRQGRNAATAILTGFAALMTSEGTVALHHAPYVYHSKILTTVIYYWVGDDEHITYIGTAR